MFDQHENQLEPWHLWGSSVVIAMPAVSSTALATTQLVRVNYKRPENWRFILSICYPNGSVGVPAGTVNLLFRFVAGIGRSNVGCGASWLYQYASSTGLIANAGRIITNFPSLKEDGITVDATMAPIEVIPAQDLQIWVDASTSGAAALTVVVSLQVAPTTHIRPEWYARDLQGLGGT